MDEFLAFEDVMVQLRLTSEELQKLVMDGRLRPTVRDGKQVFAVQEVEALKQGAAPPAAELPAWLSGGETPREVVTQPTPAAAAPAAPAAPKPAKAAAKKKPARKAKAKAKPKAKAKGKAKKKKR